MAVDLVRGWALAASIVVLMIGEYVIAGKSSSLHVRLIKANVMKKWGPMLPYI